MKSEVGFEPLTIVPQQRAKYGGLRMEEVLDMIKVLSQVAPDARYEDANTGALLQGHQEEIHQRAQAKRKGQGDPTSHAEFKRDKRSKRATEAQNERDLHTADLNQLHLVDKSPAAMETPKPDYVKPVSGRSAAFLKLVINADNEANHE